MNVTEKKKLEELRHSIKNTIENLKHREKDLEIWRESGFQEIVDLENEIRSERRRTEEKRKEFKKKFFEFIYHSINKKRVSIKERITIRDETIYKYNKNEEVNLARVCSSIDDIVEEFDIEENKEIAKEVCRKIEERDVKNTNRRKNTIYRRNRNYYMSYNLNSHKVNVTEAKNVDGHMDEYRNMYLKGENIEIKMPDFEKNVDYYNLREQYIRKLSENEKEIKYMLEQSKKAVEKMGKMERKAYKEIEEEFASFLVGIRI